MGLLLEADEGAPGRTVFAGIIRNGCSLDPNNEAGLKLECVKVLLQTGQADDDVRGIAVAMDPKNVLGLNEQVVLGKLGTVRDDVTAGAAVDALLSFQGLGQVHDSKAIQQAALMAASWCNSERLLNQPERAKQLAAWAKSLGDIPENWREMIEGLG